MLTERQQEIFRFILEFRRSNGCSPSIPEIQKHFGIRSPNGVVGHLKALESKGYIRRGARGSRQIDVVETMAPEGEPAGLPIIGNIPAGFPEARAAAAEGHLNIDSSALGFRPKAGAFVLRVRGDSMQDAGILDGDLVVIEPTPVPREKQIVAALMDGECTLKRLVREKGKWFLKAENAAYPDLHPTSDLAVQGVARAMIRRLG